MSKIKVRGEWMELSEAKTLLNKLENGTIPIELTEEERRGYSLFNEAVHEGLGEREYIIGTLLSLITLQEHRDKA